jgi:hypothetical protein
MKDTDQFALSAFSLAFALKRLLESDYHDETIRKLVQDFIKLKDRVQLHTKILDQKEATKQFQQNQEIYP